MKTYSKSTDAISHLQRHGFTNDFQLSGNDLLWLEDSLAIRVGEFMITEYYRIRKSKNNLHDIFVFGVIALHHNIKGILLSRFNTYSGGLPAVLLKKLNELDIHRVAAR
ncbi:MAG: hypothetical protein ABI675_28110 [Chitinophagaceae bacterium]